MREDIRSAIDKELESALPKSVNEDWVRQYFPQSKGKLDIAALSEPLFVPMRELLARGGKRWRPYLLLLAARFGAGEGQCYARKLAPVPELLHNATLIVDDIEDSSPLRRGKSAIHREYGTDIAVNAANFFYFYAGRYALSVTPPKLQAAVSALIDEELANVHIGQALDIYWHAHPEHAVTQARYLEMARLKTGTMARLAARLGALAGGLERAPAESLARFAETLGVVFQIRDDRENIEGAGRPGKQFGDDITEGKRSLFVIRALARLPQIKRDELTGILAKKTTDLAQITRAIELIKTTDAFAYVERLANNLRVAAHGELKALPNGAARKELEEMLTLIA